MGVYDIKLPVEISYFKTDTHTECYVLNYIIGNHQRYIRGKNLKECFDIFLDEIDIKKEVMTFK